MLIETARRGPRQAAQPRPYTRPLPPYLVIALLSLTFAGMVICALLLLILAWETVGWVRYRLAVEGITCLATVTLTLYNLIAGRAWR